MTVIATDVVPGSVITVGGVPSIVTSVSGSVITTTPANAPVGGGSAGQPLVSTGNAAPPQFGAATGGSVSPPIVFDVTNSAGAHSYQPVAVDLTLGAEDGKDAPDSAFLAPVMGNIHGDSLLETGNYLGGLIGEDSITGTQATTFAKGGVVGIVADGVSASNGPVVSILDGDSGGVTTPGAMFKAIKLNSTAGNDPDYGLDLLSAVSGFLALVPKKADVRFCNDVCILQKAGVPTDGTTGANFAGPGSLCIDITNKNAYINANTKASPTWKLITRAA